MLQGRQNFTLKEGDADLFRKAGVGRRGQDWVMKGFAKHSEEFEP